MAEKQCNLIKNGGGTYKTVSGSNSRAMTTAGQSVLVSIPIPSGYELFAIKEFNTNDYTSQLQRVYEDNGNIIFYFCKLIDASITANVSATAIFKRVP